MSIERIPVEGISSIDRRLPALMQLSRQFRLSLSPGELRMLAENRSQAIRDAGRIDLDGGGLEPLLTAFAGSPWLSPTDPAETLSELTELFYHLKNVTGDLIPDETLLRRIRELFDEPCHGSVELLADHLEGGLSWQN